jgi:uncharacterized protein
MSSEIKNRLQADVVTAMKAREKDRLGVLRQLQAALKQFEVDKRRELDDQTVMQVLQAYAKKVRDSLSSAEQAGREDLATAARAELALVESYLPAPLTDDELDALVVAAIAETGAAGPRDMGKVIQAVMPQVVGRAEGGRVSALVKSRLAG